MARVTIDGTTIEVPEGTNVVRAAEMADLEIAHYCYHPGLSVAGNCRMCLVEIKALSAKQNAPLPKLQIGCNTIVQDGMVVEANNDRVRAARRSVLEFLLINHPIDCPICDQAGECKLQEYYMDYGRYNSRFALEEKVHKGKVIPVGPEIMLDQERCILCTRCVRFLDEVTETHELTLLQRGDHTELTLATGASVDNEYSVNIVDICPVGALTSREFRFQARVWYLETANSICTGCATGCSIEVHYRDDTIYRLKPRFNPEVNGYWMCDYGRSTFHDNRAESRLQASLTREGGRFVDLDVEAVAERAARGLRSAGGVAIVASAQVSLEEAFLLASVADLLGGGEKIIVSPATSEIPDDELLISTDRYPNRQGLARLGFVEAEMPALEAKSVLVARADVAAGGGRWAELLEGLHTTVVVADRADETTCYADHVLAVGTHFEAEGSFVNRHGVLQSFDAAVAPPGRAVAGWQALSALSAALGGRHYQSVEAIREAILARTASTEGRSPSAPL